MSPTGHLAVGFAVKRFVPRIPLIVLLVTAYATDLMYLIFLATGIESVEYSPWSHSLIMVIAWSGLALLVTLLITKRIKDGVVMGLVFLSHWLLDFIVWDNMLITFDETTRVGFGLFNEIGLSQTNLFVFNTSTIIASLVELTLLAIGVTMFILSQRKIRMKRAATFTGPTNAAPGGMR